MGTVLSVVLVTYAVVGLYVRPEADDFCFAVAAHEHGIFGSVTNAYATYFGRYSQVVVTGAVSYFGSAGSQLMPLVLIAGLVAGTWYALRPLTPRAWLLALAATVAFLQALPNVWQSLYWQSASETYVVPIVLALVLAGMIKRQAHPALLALVGFAAAGFNEGFSPTLIVALGLAWLAAPRYRTAITAATVGVVIGAIVMVAAPGNSIRAANAAFAVSRPSLLLSLRHAFENGAEALVSLAVAGLGSLLALGALTADAFARVRISRLKRVRGTLLLLLSSMLLSGVAVLAPQWSVGESSGRVLTLNAVLAVFAVAAIFSLVRVRLAPWVVAGLILLSSAPTVVMLAGAQQQLAPYARAFDRGVPAVTYARLAGLAEDRQPGCYALWRSL